MTIEKVIEMIDARIDIYEDLYDSCGNVLDDHTARVLSYGGLKALKELKNKIEEGLL